jgi:hypothetical protein
VSAVMCENVVEKMNFIPSHWMEMWVTVVYYLIEDCECERVGYDCALDEHYESEKVHKN